MNYNKFPGIDNTDDFINPTITSPFSHFDITFYETMETLGDVEEYKNFLDNAITRFRRSPEYKLYKGYLHELGLNRCIINGNLYGGEDGQCTLEMHHAILTIFDIALIISEHTLKTYGKINTFQLVMMLENEHVNNRVGLAMMSLTPHQLYHNTEELVIHPDAVFGNWYEFLERYRFGITIEIAYKVIRLIDRAIQLGTTDTGSMMILRKHLLDWSEFNRQSNMVEYAYR